MLPCMASSPTLQARLPGQPRTSSPLTADCAHTYERGYSVSGVNRMLKDGGEWVGLLGKDTGGEDRVFCSNFIWSGYKEHI